MIRWSSCMLADSSKSQTTVSLWSLRWRRISRASWSSATPISLTSKIGSPAILPPPLRSAAGATGSRVKGDPPRPSTLTPGRLDPSLIRPLPTPRTLGVFEGRPVPTPPATITPPPSSPSPSPTTTIDGLTWGAGILVADGPIARDVVWVSVDRQQLLLAVAVGGQRRVEVEDLLDRIRRCEGRSGQGRQDRHVDH